MRAEFVNEVGRILGVRRTDLIEKDFILHQVLLDLSRSRFFAPNFLFKGGTCLIKSYFGYLRFSEDIDFTWKDQSAFDGKSQKAIRGYLSRVIDTTGEVFETIAANRGLDFKCEKHNPNYAEFGGGNKTCTFKVWYNSAIMRRRSFLKVQINFVEPICFPARRRVLSGLLTGEHPELDVLFPEYAEYAKRIRFGVYDIREILSEKVRTLLTREGTKARDFLDIYFISKKPHVRPSEVERCIAKKLAFALKMYSKYRANLKAKLGLLNTGRLFEWGEERDLLLTKIDDGDFYAFLDEFNTFLKRILRESI